MNDQPINSNRQNFCEVKYVVRRLLGEHGTGTSGVSQRNWCLVMLDYVCLTHSTTSLIGYLVETGIFNVSWLKPFVWGTNLRNSPTPSLPRMILPQLLLTHTSFIHTIYIELDWDRNHSVFLRRLYIFPIWSIMWDLDFRYQRERLILKFIVREAGIFLRTNFTNEI